MGEVATERGLSEEQLEDRIVPDLGLDERGRRTFDYGPRQFRLVFGPNLKPLLRDVTGGYTTRYEYPIAQMLTVGPVMGRDIAFSPTGDHIAFFAKKERGRNLVIVNALNGRIEQSIPLKVEQELSPAYSPDGSKIAFISLEGVEPGSDPRVFTPGQERHRRLWTVRMDDEIPQAVTPDGITVWEYAWSPDGRQFALYSSPRPDETGWYHGQVGLVDAEGGTVHQLTHFSPVSTQARALAWSPDGRQLAYISGKWSDPGRGAGEISLLSLEKGQSRNLTPGIACSPTWCAWFPDGRRLLYTAVEGVSHLVDILDTVDDSIRVIDRAFVMQWDQPRLSPTPDLNSFATVHSTSQQPPDAHSAQMLGAERGRQLIDERLDLGQVGDG